MNGKLVRFVLVFIWLLFSNTLYAADSYEPDNSMVDANPLSVGITYQDHEIDPVSDIDWISFEAIQNHGYVIELANEVGGDVLFGLFNENENQLLSSISGTADWVCPLTGTYYIKTHEYGSNATATYQLRVLPAYWNGEAVWDTHFEPDYSDFVAHLVPTDGTVMHHENSEATDIDWMRISAHEGTTYTFSLTNEAGGDYRFYVYDADVRDISGYQTTSWVWTCPATGTYYVRLYEYGANNTGSFDFAVTSNAMEYSVDIPLEQTTLYLDTTYGVDTFQLVATSSNCDGSLFWASSDASVVTVGVDGLLTATGAGTAVVTATCPGQGTSDSIVVTVNADDYEPNNDRTQAQPIAVGQIYQSHQLTPNAPSPDQYDWISFEAVQGYGYVIELANEVGGNVRFYLYNENGDTLISDINVSAQWECPLTGTYYIRTHEYSHDQWVSYQLRVLPAYWNGNAVWDADFEPDNSDFIAHPVPTDGVARHHVNNDASDTDWVRLSAAEGTTYTFALTNEAGGDYRFYVYDADVRDISGYQTSSWVWTCPATGTFYVQLYEYGSNHVGSFDFAITSDAMEYSVDIPLEQTTLYLDTTYGVDTFQLVATSSNCDGSLVWSSSDASVVTVGVDGLLTAQGAGTAVVTATCPGQGTSDSIVVTVNADDYEPNNDRTQAQSIAVGQIYQSHQLKPNAASPDQWDWISFEGVQGYGYVIQLANEVGGNVRFYLYNQNGDVLISDISTATNWTCPLTGTYYIRTHEYSHDQWVSYQLRVLPAYWNGDAVWDADFEPDYNEYLACLVPTDGTTFHHANGNPVDIDWLRISAQEGTTYTFSLTNEAGGNYYFNVYDTALTSQSGSQSTSWVWTCPVDGTYYVKLWEDDINHVGSFDFAVTSDALDYSVDIPLEQTTLYLDTTYGVDTFQLVATSSNCDGSLVWSSSDASVVTVGVNGLLTAQGTGTAVVTATCPGQGTSDSIVVTVNADDYEPNNDRTQAQSIAVGQIYQSHQLKPTASSPDTYDWISFEAVQGYGYVIELANEVGGNVRFYLYNENGDTLISDISTSIKWTCPLTGIYYIRTHEYSHDQWVSYQLRVLPAYWNGDAVWDVAFEPDYSDYLAYLVPTDGTIYHHENSNPADIDWVRISAQEGTTYTFSLTNEAGGNYYFNVYDTALTSQSGSQSTSWVWTCPVNGTYYVTLWEDDNNHVGSFDFAITSDALDYSVDIPLEQPTLYLDTTYGVDTFQLVATSSNCDGSLVWSSSDASVVTVGVDGLLTAQGTGTAVVTATCPGQGTSDSIVVTVNADDYEPNDDRTQAQPIAVGQIYQSHQLKPTASSPDTYDWVKFDAVQGHGYVIEILNETAGNVYGRLVNENGDILISEFNGDLGKEWTCPLTGTYYLRMWENNNDSCTSYQVRILPAYWNGDAQWNSSYEPDNVRYCAFQIRTDGTSYHHQNDNPIDTDWVGFSAQEGTTYTFALTNEAGGNFYFNVYDPDLRNLSSSRSVSWAWTCPVNGTYFVKLWEDGENHVGSFDFAITSDALDYSVDIPLEQTTLYLDPAYGVDTFQLVATSSNCGGSLVWSSSDASVVTVDVDGLLTAQGTGTAVVTATCPGQGASDSIVVTVNADDYEPNDDRTQAQPIAVGQTYQSHQLKPTASSPDTYDWVKFEAVQDHGYVIEILNETAGNVYGRLVNENGDILISEFNGDLGKEWTCPLTGTYYLRMWENNNDSCTSYQVRILPAYWNSDAQWNSSYEPDNVRYCAFQIRTDGTSYHHQNDNPIDTDWVRFSAQEGTTYTFALTNEAGGNFYFNVYDPDLRNLSSSRSVSWAWTCPVDGTYYVTLWEDDNNHVGSFDFAITSDAMDYSVDIPLEQTTLYLDPAYGVDTFQLVATSSNCDGSPVWSSSDASVVTVGVDGLLTAQGAGTAVVTATCPGQGTSDSIVVTVNADDYEPNNDRTQAQPIAVGQIYQSHQLKPTASSPDTYDWVKFDAVQGHGYVIEILNETAGNVYGRLVNENGDVLISDFSGDGGRQWTCLLTGTYYLRMWENNNDSCTSYQVRILPAYWNGDAQWNSFYEPDSTIYNSCFICTDNNANHGYNERSDDYDWFRFYGIQGSDYVISLINEMGGNFYFRLYDGNFEAVSGNITSTLSWNCTETGIYHVAVWEYGEDQLGSYDLTIAGDPVAVDSDADGMIDCWELHYFGTGNLNHDGTVDSDDDGLTDLEEHDYLPSNDYDLDPTRWDTDGDTIPDGWEVENEIDPVVFDCDDDPDIDGLTNCEEYANDTDPHDWDTDDDLMPDGWEVKNVLNPTEKDALDDADGDLLNNLSEYQNQTDPHNPDSDDDGMTDGWEVTFHLNPLFDDSLLDKDGDRFCNLREFFSLTNPDDGVEIPNFISIYVDVDNNTGIEWGTLADPFNTISEGIVFAGPEDSIIVAAGNYIENLVVDKNLTITGEDRFSTIIDGGANSQPAIQVTGMTAGTIEGFGIRNGSNAGIYCEQSILTITNNLISHVIAGNETAGDGIVVRDNSAVMITHNIIHTNDINGISIAATASAQIVNNTIVDNGTSGIDCLAGDAVVIKNNIIVQNGLYGIMCEGATAPVIYYNNLWSNYIADYFGCSDGVDDISDDPLFADMPGKGFHLTICSPSIDAGDPASDVAEEPLPNGGRINMGAFGGTPEAIRSIAQSADMENDGDVDGADLFQFTLQIGNMDCAGCLQDFDEDGDVDQDDLIIFTCKFGY